MRDKRHFQTVIKEHPTHQDWLPMHVRAEAAREPPVLITLRTVDLHQKAIIITIQEDPEAVITAPQRLINLLEYAPEHEVTIVLRALPCVVAEVIEAEVQVWAEVPVVDKCLI